LESISPLPSWGEPTLPLRVPDNEAPAEQVHPEVVPWSLAALPHGQVARVFITTSALRIAGELDRNVVIGFRLQFAQRKIVAGTKRPSVELPAEASQKRDSAKSLQEAHFKAAIYALETLTLERPDLVGVVPVKVHTEHWEVAKVLMDEGWRQLSLVNRTMAKQLFDIAWPYKPHKLLLADSWGKIKRAKDGGSQYRKQFRYLHERLRRMAYGEGDGKKRFLVNLFDLGDLRRKPALEKCLPFELLCYHVVRQRGRKAADVAAALAMTPKMVHNAVNRVDVKMRRKRAEAAKSQAEVGL
jgi:hypothetical protein